MAFAKVQEGHGAGSGNTATGTFDSGATAAGNVLLAFVCSGDAATDQAVTPPANWVQVGSTIHSDPVFAIGGSVWVYANNPGGITSAAFTFTPGGVSGWSVKLLEFSGAVTASPVDAQQVHAQVGTGAWSASATSTHDGDLLVGAVLWDQAAAGSLTITHGGGWTATSTVSDSPGFGWTGIDVGYQVAGVAGAQSYTPGHGGANTDATVALIALTASDGSAPLTASPIVGHGVIASAALTIDGALLASPIRGHGVFAAGTLAITLAAPTIPPQPMPLISAGLATYASDIDFAPTNATDSQYGSVWRSVLVPSVGTPQWLAVDVSSKHPGLVLLSILNEHGNQYLDPDFSQATSLPEDYKLQVNAAAGGAGSAPSSGWVDRAIVTGNTYPTRQHMLDLTGYNWVRVIVTASAGSPAGGNNDVGFNLDIHDASAGYMDRWLFLGDSITEEGQLHPQLGGGEWGYGGPISPNVRALRPVYYPATIDAGNGGQTMAWADSNSAALLNGYAGGFVSIAFGTNDANQSFPFTAGDANVTAYYAHLLAVIDAALALNNVVVVPHVPYAPNNAGILGANAKLLNDYVDAHLATDRPSVLRGPDFWSFFQANPSLIRTEGDGVTRIHPTYLEVAGARSGYEEMIRLWTEWLAANIYLIVYTPLAAAPVIGYGVIGHASLGGPIPLAASPIRGRGVIGLVPYLVAPSYIPASELAQAQADAAFALLDKTATITRRTGPRLDDGYGHTITTPAQVHTLVPCNMTRPTSGLFRDIAARLSNLSTWDVSFAMGTDVLEGDSVTVAGHTLTVHSLGSPESFPILLHVLCAETS